MTLEANKRFLVGLLLFIFVVHGWALWTSAYFYVWWLDLALHFLGGLWLGAFSIFLFANHFQGALSQGRFLSFVLILGVVSLGGVLWEIFEYGFDRTLGRELGGAFAQLGVDDIMTDLISDLVGGVAAYGIFRRKS